MTPHIEFDPDNDPLCVDDQHVFFGAEEGQRCVCGLKELTEAEVAETKASPMGLLISANLAPPFVWN